MASSIETTCSNFIAFLTAEKYHKKRARDHFLRAARPAAGRAASKNRREDVMDIGLSD